MALMASGGEELSEDFLLALQLSEGYDQYGLGSCGGPETDEDFLLALKLSEEFDRAGLGGNGQFGIEDDYLLALKLSEGFDRLGGDNGQLETDSAFTRRFERELNGGGSTGKREDEPSMVSADITSNVVVLREWYVGSRGQASKLVDLLQHLNFLDDVMLCERSGLRLTAAAGVAPGRNLRQVTNFFPRSPRKAFGDDVFLTPGKPAPVQLGKTHGSGVDRKVSAAFNFISASLSDSAGDIVTDQGRRPIVAIISAMLDLSLFSETTETLLRNDSIKDLAERLDLVKSLLGLLRVMSLQDEYRSILTRPRRLKKRTMGLQGIAESRPEAAVTSVIVLEDEREPKSQPLFDLLGRLKMQAEVYLKGARSSGGSAFQSGEGAASISLCEYLVEMYNSMLSSMGSVSPTNSSKKGFGAKIGLSRPTVMAAAPQEGPLPELPNALDWSAAILETHCYKREAERIVKPLPGRQPKLVRQITELTNLPEGIFVRVVDSRPDVLKALIVGPRDTPYEGGLFEFDVLAPEDFPTSPPKVALKTTGGGQVRFNPNLYADGKVCLSLINTWHGNATEKWLPGSSTLLQVFVSIQSMIFVECPYTNEPGREGLTGILAGEQHKEFVRANTIRWGMIDWIQDSSKRKGIWKDVVKAHFLRNTSQLQRRIRDSAAGNVGIWHYHGNITEDTLVRNGKGGMNLEKEFDRCLSLLK